MKKDASKSIGIDLGTQSLKAVLLDIKEESPKIESYQRVLISDGGESFSKAELVEVIKANLKGWVPSNGLVHLSVSSKDVIVRYIEMPKMKEAELKNSLQYEADRYLPFKLADAYFDTQVLLESLPQDATKMWIVLVAAKKSVVEKKIALFTEAGIHLDSVDVVPVALINAYEAFASVDMKKKAVLIIDVGAASSSINILSEGVPYLSREVDFGGNPINKLLMKSLSKEYAEVEKMKSVEGVKWEGPLLRLINSFLKTVKASLDYYEGKNEKTIEQIYLSGGSAAMPGLKELLSKEFDRPVDLIVFKDNLNRSALENPKEFDSFSHEFAVALGLAIKGNDA